MIIPELQQMYKDVLKCNPSLNIIPSKVAESKHDLAKELQLFGHQICKPYCHSLTPQGHKGASLRRKKVVQNLSKINFWIGCPKLSMDQPVKLP